MHTTIFLNLQYLQYFNEMIKFILRLILFKKTLIFLKLSGGDKT